MSDKLIRLNFVVDAETRKRIKRLAAVHDTTISDIIRSSVMQKLEELEKQSA